MKLRGVLIVAAVVLVGVIVGLASYSWPNDRFGDPAVLEQIDHANCAELRDWSDAVLQLPAGHTDKELDQAVGYSNAANERMKELHCFEN